MKKFLTTPIYYANGKPHIGHACTSILADITKRSLELKGHEVFLSTGLDEHGQKNQQVIESRNTLASDYFNEITINFKDLFSKLDISYNTFINTTSEKHIKVVKEILNKLYDEGYFFKKKHTGKYCEGCEQFKQDSELTKDGCCPDHLKPAIIYSEENWFFNLNKQKEWLTKLLETDTFLTDYYRKEMLNLIKDDMPDLCISRPKNRVWLGVPLPFDENFVTYVWFDALINYITVIGYPNIDKSLWNESTHFLAKDIVKPHSIYWPIMLKAIGLPPPKRELVHGYLTNLGLKMGKSIGNGLNPEKATEIFGSDAVRWCLSKVISKTDADLNYEIMLNIFNTELANVVGNSFYRTYTLARKTFTDGKTPKADFDSAETDFLNSTLKSLENILPDETGIENVSGFIKNLTSVFRNINLYLDSSAPWNEKDLHRKEQKLLSTLEALRMCFEIASVVLVKSSKQVLTVLGCKMPEKSTKFTLKQTAIPANFTLSETTPLFVRMTEKDLEEKLSISL